MCVPYGLLRSKNETFVTHVFGYLDWVSAKKRLEPSEVITKLCMKLKAE